jgi:16S rRNA (guanine527-N7)-methyltransferase
MESNEPMRRKHIADIPENLEAQRPVLLGYLGELGLTITEEQADKLIEYLVLMLRQNETMNLTAIKEWDKALLLHLVDSLVVLPEFKAVVAKNHQKSFLDMGSGAGLPGIPLAIVEEQSKGLLCDSVKKKMAAVDGFIGKLGLDNRLQTTSQRLEDLGREKRGQFGCITARALASLPVLIEYATPLLCKGGSFIAIKGKPEKEELESGSRAAKICGLAVQSIRTVELPRDSGERTIIVYEKVVETAIKLPRQVGEATKKPLA